MKNKTSIQRKDFRTFRTKIFVRTLIMIAIAIAVTFSLYSFVLHGHFANFMVAAFQNGFRMEYSAAYNLYQQIFRNHFDLIVICGLSIVFLTIFRIYLNWFTNYFEEINSGMDSLINGSTEEISLSAELFPMERKFNIVKHTLEKQKNDMIVEEQRKNLL